MVKLLCSAALAVLSLAAVPTAAATPIVFDYSAQIGSDTYSFTTVLSDFPVNLTTPITLTGLVCSSNASRCAASIGFYGISNNDVNATFVVGAGGQFRTSAFLPFDHLGFYLGSDRLSGVNISLVPEPTSWALMIVGFGLTGAFMRKRQFRVAFC